MFNDNRLKLQISSKINLKKARNEEILFLNNLCKLYRKIAEQNKIS
jgi:hypothetical protein